MGFEPTVGLTLRLISSQVHSATLPSLQRQAGRIVSADTPVTMLCVRVVRGVLPPFFARMNDESDDGFFVVLAGRMFGSSAVAANAPARGGDALVVSPCFNA